MRDDTRELLTAAAEEPIDELGQWPIDAVHEALLEKWVEVPEALDHDLVVTQAGRAALATERR